MIFTHLYKSDAPLQNHFKAQWLQSNGYFYKYKLLQSSYCSIPMCYKGLRRFSPGNGEPPTYSLLRYQPENSTYNITSPPGPLAEASSQHLNTLTPVQTLLLYLTKSLHARFKSCKRERAKVKHVTMQHLHSREENFPLNCPGSAV